MWRKSMVWTDLADEGPLPIQEIWRYLNQISMSRCIGQARINRVESWHKRCVTTTLILERHCLHFCDFHKHYDISVKPSIRLYQIKEMIWEWVNKFMKGGANFLLLRIYFIQMYKSGNGTDTQQIFVDNTWHYKVWRMEYSVTFIYYHLFWDVLWEHGLRISIHILFILFGILSFKKIVLYPQSFG